MNQKKLLLAESGATKTDWVLLDGGQQVQAFATKGLNPSNLDDAQIQWVLSSEVQQVLKLSHIDKVLFYGAGCAKDPNQSRMRQSLKLSFAEAEVEVYSDLKAAAVATLGRTPGLVGILGTGSSVAIYTGENIERILTVGEFPEGDRGSGSHIGSELLMHVLKDSSFRDIEESMNLEQMFKDTQVPKTGKTVAASFLKTMIQYREETWFASIVSRCLDDFFDRLQAFNTEFDEISFVGSVAYLFPEELKKSADRVGFKIGSVVKSPIQELIKYHTNTDD